MKRKKALYDKNIADNFEDDTIDLLEVLDLWRKKIWTIILCGLLGFLSGYCLSQYVLVPEYEACSMVYMNNATKIVSISDLQLGVSLTSDFSIITKSRKVLNEVIEELNLNTSYESLVDTITISNPTDSHILEIKVVNKDPQLAAEISNCVAERLRERISMIMNTDRPSIVEDAVAPLEKVGPDAKQSGLIGALIAIVIAGAVILILDLSDQSIKTKEDIEFYLDMNMLAMIPKITEEETKADKRRSRKRGFFEKRAEKTKPKHSKRRKPKHIRK